MVAHRGARSLTLARGDRPNDSRSSRYFWWIGVRQTDPTVPLQPDQDPTILFLGGSAITDELDTVTRGMGTDVHTPAPTATEYRLDSIDIRFGTIHADSNPGSASGLT